jgi:hypothetical protein
MAEKIRECRDVHPRVAHILETEGWCYVHEYKPRLEGSLDFLAIKRDTNQLAIIECKRAIESINDIIWQVNHYARLVSIKEAFKVVFTAHPPTKETIRALKAESIMIYGVDMDAPAVTQYRNEPVELKRLMSLHHVITPWPRSNAPLPPVRG